MARKVDVLAIDTAHGHSAARDGRGEAPSRAQLPEVQLITGNVATYEGARELISLGVDGIKVGIGPGSICTTRVVSGRGRAADHRHRRMLARDARKPACR